MNENLRKLYVNNLNTLFNQVDESSEVMDNIQFAEMAHLILEDKLGFSLNRRGQSLTGEPVGYVLDSTSTDAKIVAEYSCEEKYFTDKKLTKIEKDIKHCLEKAPNVETIYLISNRTAGPSVYTEYTNYTTKKSKELNKKIEILDARKLSEYIIDNIITKQNENLIVKLTQYIPIIKKLNEEYIYTNTLPQNDDDFVERTDNKSDILELLHQNNHVLLHGISGIGKTDIAKDIAKELHEEYSIVWIDGSTLNKPEDLKATKIERYNVSQNIIGLMNNSKVCLVIDDLTDNAKSIISYIESNVELEYKLIITSQIIEDDVESAIEINLLPEELCQQILNNGLKSHCSDEILNVILKKIGGHPFLLKQINIIMKNTKYSKEWKDILYELNQLVSRPFENRITFYSRLFENHLKVIPDLINSLKWIDNKYIEFSLLKSLVGFGGIDELEKRAFFNIKNGTFFKLHDLVFDSLKYIEVTSDEKVFEAKLASSLKDYYLTYSSNYFRIIYTHSNLISKLLSSDKYDVFSYSYVNALPINEFPNKNIKDYSDIEVNTIFKLYSSEKYFELFTWIELVEKEYLFKKEVSSPKERNEFLIQKIEKIESYLIDSELPQDVYIEVQNHLAKFYRNSGNKGKAIEIFEDIISKQSDYWVAKLHLSKLIRSENDRKQEAEKLIQEILEAFKNGQEVSSTVVLAAYIEIRSYKKLEEVYLIDLIENFHELINSVLVDKFDMPYQTLSALSSRIQFKYPDKMIKMTEELPIPSEESVKKSILFDIGQIYFNTSKAYFDLSNQEKALENAGIAKIYFETMKSQNPYQKRMVAENYLILGDAQKAISQLDTVDAEKREIWWKYTYSKALSLSENNDDALILISECINEATYSKDTFYRERANIKIRAGMDSCDDLKMAYKLCGDEKFKDMIKKEIIQNKCQI